jgi:hypothetical protein
MLSLGVKAFQNAPGHVSNAAALSRRVMFDPVPQLGRQSQSNLFVQLFAHAASNDRSDKAGPRTKLSD